MKAYKVLALTVLVSGSVLFAQSNGPLPFSSYDTNGDGSITQKEFSYMKNERMKERYEEGRMLKNATNSPNFEQIDKNGDGKINRNEYQIHQENQFKKRIEQRNQNNNNNQNQFVPGSGMGMGAGKGK